MKDNFVEASEFLKSYEGPGKAQGPKILALIRKTVKAQKLELPPLKASSANRGLTLEFVLPGCRLCFVCDYYASESYWIHERDSGSQCAEGPLNKPDVEVPELLQAFLQDRDFMGD